MIYICGFWQLGFTKSGLLFFLSKYVFHKSKVEQEWLHWKEAEEQLRSLGVDEDTIQRLHSSY